MNTPEQPDQHPVHSSDHDDANMRREARLHTDELNCSMGRVADITGSGMRLILPKGNLPQIADVQSYTFKDGSDTIEVTGCIKWVRKGSAFTRHAEAGVEFVKLDQAQRDALVRLAVRGKIKEPRSNFVHIAPADLYKLLGVTRYASSEQIDEAFSTCCNRFSGDDRAKMPQTTQKLDEVYKAYAVLSDPEKRAQYDTRYADQHDRAA